MPKSKRAKVVHLSKTKRKGKELTLRLYANIQECIPNYPYIYVFSVHNMRNTYLKDVRTQLSDSRLFFGKTKVMAVALGLTSATEPYPGTSLLTPHIHGSVGLLFSPRPPPALIGYFASFTPSDYARAGTVASRSFTIPPGVVYSRGGEIPADEDVPMAHSMEATLRKFNVPTKLVKGKVLLECEEPGFVVCSEGQRLGSGQTSLLKIFGVAMAEFRVGLEACWEGETGEVAVLDGGVERQSMAANGGMDVDVDDDEGLNSEEVDVNIDA